MAGKIPATAEPLARLIVENVGAPPPAGIVRTWYAVPAAVVLIVPLPLPRRTPLLVRVVTPVPPRLTPNTPEVTIEADRLGMSASTRPAP